MHLSDIKAIGETERLEFSIPEGESEFTYIFIETYTEAPFVKFYLTGELIYEEDITNTQVTLTLPHSNGVEHCGVIVFIQKDI